MNEKLDGLKKYLEMRESGAIMQFMMKLGQDGTVALAMDSVAAFYGFLTFTRGKEKADAALEHLIAGAKKLAKHTNDGLDGSQDIEELMEHLLQ